VAGWLVSRSSRRSFDFRVSALAQRLSLLVIVAGFPLPILTCSSDHHTEGHRANRRPTGLAKATPCNARGWAWIANELRAGSSACAQLATFVLDVLVLRRDSAQATSNAKSIAVLPLVNTSGRRSEMTIFPWPVGGTYRCSRQDSRPQDQSAAARRSVKGKSDDSRTIGEKAGRDEPARRQRAQQGDACGIVAE